jgi:integrase
MEKVRFYLDKRSTMKDGTHPIRLYIKNVGRFRLSTNFSSKEEEWGENGYIVAKYRARNAVLNTMINKVQTFMLTCGNLSDEELKKELEKFLFNKEKKTKKNFIFYLKEFIRLKQRPGTKRVYTETLRKLEKYDPNCTLESIDRKWLINFDNWLAKTMKINARSIHLRNMRAVFNYCLDEEITTNYPFRRFSIKKEETVKRALTVEQLRLLRDYPVEPFQEKYRDIFMLMFYLIGINCVDLFSLTVDNVSDNRLIYHRAKTNKLYNIKIEPEAQIIIDKYKGEKKLIDLPYTNYENFRHQMDHRLKEIGEYDRVGRGGKKVFHPILPNITTYASRHTWATLASELDIPKETISAALGHEIGSSVTSIYIKLDKDKVDEANRQVIDYVNGYE